MIRRNKVQIVFILLFFFGVFVFSQDKQVNEDKDRQLREETLAVYKSKGEQGLRDFVKKKMDKITNKFILDFAEAGVKERKEEWLKVCEIVAKEKKDEKTLAEIYYELGKYFKIYSDNKKAIEYFCKSLPIYEKINDFVGQGKVYLGRIDIYIETADYNSANKLIEKTLFLFEKGRSYSGQGHVYFRRGDIYYFTSNTAKALEMYDKALFFFDKIEYLWGQGHVHMKKGDIYFYAGNNSKAFEMYDKAMSFFEKSQNYWGQADVNMRKGRIYFSACDYFKALEMYENGLRFYEKLESLNGLGDYCYRKAEIYQRICQYSTSLELFEKAQSYFEKSNNPIGLGNVYLAKGEIYLHTGEISKANELCNKALSIFRKSGNLFGCGNAYEMKADIHFYYGNISKAIYMLEEALHFYINTENISGQGYVYSKKGRIYSRVNDYQKALKFFKKAMHCFKSADEPFALGNVYYELGDVFFYNNDNINANKMYNKALYFYEKSGAITEQGNVYLKKGEIYFSKGDNSKTLEMYEKARSCFKEVKEPWGQGNLHRNIGDIYLKMGDNSKAVEMYDKALSNYSKIEDIESISYTLYRKATGLERQGRLSEALNLLEKSISNLEMVRSLTTFSDMKITLMERLYNQYEETVLFMLENRHHEKGFKYSEAMRTRVFLDQMAEGLVGLEKGLKPELKEERNILVAKLSFLSKEIHKTAGKKDEKKLQELKEQYYKIENDFKELLIKIRLENPLYASIRYPQPITVQALQKEVLKKSELLVRYFISSDKIYVFLVSKKKFKVIPLEVKKEEINGTAKRYLLAIKENNPNDMRRYGRLLYEKLFKPLEKRLKKSKNIIIIPDGHLATIPFESLIIDKKESGRPVFLLEKYRVKYIQSASILSVLREYYQRDSETKNFIGFGDPVYDYENFRQGKPEQGSKEIFATESTEETEPILSHEDTRSDAKVKRLSSVPSVSSVAIEDEIMEIHRSRYARAGGIMDRLPHSGEEIKTIARLFEQKSQKCKIYLRDHASEDNAKSPDLKEFDYIHFSCHGLLNDDFQSLVLSQIPGAEEDGYLTLNEIMNCDYNAKLVVLSACQTGTGKMERAEGVTGLTRAVMYAGTPAVLASLWKVDDNATKELMVRFYKNILEKNLDKTEALRQAKLELLKNPKYSSPLFWSAFVLYGE